MTIATNNVTIEPNTYYTLSDLYGSNLQGCFRAGPGLYSNPFNEQQEFFFVRSPGNFRQWIKVDAVDIYHHYYPDYIYFVLADYQNAFLYVIRNSTQILEKYEYDSTKPIVENLLTSPVWSNTDAGYSTILAQSDNYLFDGLKVYKKIDGSIVSISGENTSYAFEYNNDLFWFKINSLPNTLHNISKGIYFDQYSFEHKYNYFKLIATYQLLNYKQTNGKIMAVSSYGKLDFGVSLYSYNNSLSEWEYVYGSNVMVALFDPPISSSSPDNIYWCAYGSDNFRRAIILGDYIYLFPAPSQNITVTIWQLSRSGHTDTSFNVQGGQVAVMDFDGNHVKNITVGESDDYLTPVASLINMFNYENYNEDCLFVFVGKSTGECVGKLVKIDTQINNIVDSVEPFVSGQSLYGGLLQ